MRIYMHADAGHELADDLARLKEVTHHGLVIMRVGIGHWAVDDVVSRLADRGVTALILPDQYARHTDDMYRVKQCALLMDREVMPLTHFLGRVRKKLNPKAPPPALAGQPRLPVVGGDVPAIR